MNSNFNITPNDTIKEIIFKAAWCTDSKIVQQYYKYKKEKKNADLSNVSMENTPLKQVKHKMSKSSSTNYKSSNSKKQISMSMMDFLENQQSKEKTPKIDLKDPDEVIKAVEKELKQVKVIPKSESFTTQIGGFYDIRIGKSNEDKNSSPKEIESKKKKKLLEFIMVII